MKYIQEEIFDERATEQNTKTKGKHTKFEKLSGGDKLSLQNNNLIHFWRSSVCDGFTLWCES